MALPSQLKLKPNSLSIMHRVSESFKSLVLGCLLLVSGALVQSLSAQDGKRSDAPYLGASEVAFEWQYSCTNGKACSFSCPGSGGASNVTKLTLQLGSIPLGDDQKAFGIFYKFSTMQIPRANGFSLTTGISTLSCQVNGMDLDYSGPRKSAGDDAPTASIPSQDRGSQSQVR
jgi:hypothetical protein